MGGEDRSPPLEGRSIDRFVDTLRNHHSLSSGHRLFLFLPLQDTFLPKTPQILIPVQHPLNQVLVWVTSSHVNP